MEFSVLNAIFVRKKPKNALLHSMYLYDDASYLSKITFLIYALRERP